MGKSNRKERKDEMVKAPNPGSDAAIDLGCICPVLDNGHGNEQLGKERGFWISADCELHALN
jgi:hypothetical protein